MLNSIKISIMFMILGLLVLLPRASYAWGEDHDRGHQGHGGYSHRNPDLTLISGMDTIDRRVLIAADPDPAPEDVYQPVLQPIVLSPAQTFGSDMDVFIVNVLNYKGGYTQRRIQKFGNGYLGPQGEFYYPFPQISQLKAMYGI